MGVLKISIQFTLFQQTWEGIVLEHGTQDKTKQKRIFLKELATYLIQVNVQKNLCMADPEYFVPGDYCVTKIIPLGCYLW